MAFIQNKGNPSSKVWVIVNEPLSGDKDKGFLYSAPLGWVFDKMMKEAGIPDYYVFSRRTDPENGAAYRDTLGELNKHQPPIIIALGNASAYLCDELIPKRKGPKYNPDKDSEISKYAGSLLQCKQLPYPHYVIPTYEPMDIVRQWKQRDIVINCDLGKAATELEYLKINGVLQPLPKRTPKIDFESFDELLSLLESFKNYPYVSNDIETIYPKTGSIFKKIHPGYPITIGLAPSKEFGISFDLFREDNTETIKLWRTLNSLLSTVPSVGQNFFNFDSSFYEALGFTIPLALCRDTMIQHHLLWPELPHKLQFLARQYTREPFWKDEGAGWTIKNMRGMKIYNCKDVMVTMEIFEEQQKEFKDRGIL